MEEDALLIGITEQLREAVANSILDHKHSARLNLSKSEIDFAKETQNSDFVTLETLKVVNQVLQRAKGNKSEHSGLKQLLAGAKLKMRRRDCEAKKEVCF